MPLRTALSPSGDSSSGHSGHPAPHPSAASQGCHAGIWGFLSKNQPSWGRISSVSQPSPSSSESTNVAASPPLRTLGAQDGAGSNGMDFFQKDTGHGATQASIIGRNLLSSRWPSGEDSLQHIPGTWRMGGGTQQATFLAAPLLSWASRAGPAITSDSSRLLKEIPVTRWCFCVCGICWDLFQVWLFGQGMEVSLQRHRYQIKPASLF